MAKNLNDLRNDFFRKACSDDDLFRVKDLIENDIGSKINLKRGLLTACVNGSMSVVKYLFETPTIREKIDLNSSYGEENDKPLTDYTLTSDRLLIDSYFNSKQEIVDYLLFDVKINVSDSTQDALRVNGTYDLLNKIEKRDLFYKLNEEINIPKAEDKKLPKTKV
jgi:hypothetical protein